MAFFFRKQARIEQGFEAFSGCIRRSLDLFLVGMRSYLEHGLGESFETSVELIHRAESEADDLRVELERTLYAQELMPDSRGDMRSLLEACDKVANRIEDVFFFISMRRIEPLDELREDFLALLGPVEACVITLLEAMRTLFTRPKEVRAVVERVDSLESEADRIQHRIIRAVYAMELELARKMQVDQLVQEIGSICDTAENAAHRLDITAIKRTL